MARPARTAKHRQAAVVGIHTLPFAKDIGMTERHSGALAILGALKDAGLRVSDVDAMFRYYWENSTEMEMARILGVRNLRMFGEVDSGGGAGPPTVQLAALAIENNLADVVVVWRARNRGSGGRPWASQYMAMGQDQFERPYHVARPVDGMAFHFRYWLHKYGWTPEVTGRVAVTQREHARRNPLALMQKPMTMDDYLSARMIADPLRLFDCCLEPDGALAMVLTSADRAKDLDVTMPSDFTAGIVPIAARHAMGNGDNAIPFSWTPTKYQQVFRVVELPATLLMNWLGVRNDNRTDACATVDMELTLGYTTLDETTLTATYATNYNSGTPTVVMARQKVLIPNMPAANSNPYFFFHEFKFDRPFVWAQQTGRNFLVQAIVFGNDKGNANLRPVPQHALGIDDDAAVRRRHRHHRHAQRRLGAGDELHDPVAGRPQVRLGGQLRQRLRRHRQEPGQGLRDAQPGLSVPFCPPPMKG